MTESGIYGREATFVLGFLKVDNAEVHEGAILNLRNQSGYRSKLTYRSNDNYKREFTKSLLDLFSSSSDFKLYVKYSDITGQIGNVDSKLSSINEYKIDLVNELTDRIGTNPEAIITKYQSLNGPSESFRSSFKDRTGINHGMAVTRDSILLQLSSYLTSTVAAMVNDKINHPVKSELTEHFKLKADVNNFDSSFNKGNIYYYK
ncbi:MAG: hypothetical protein ACI86M_002692 [Saprospiraceae bacterium]|jgi:hypothetical protein